MSILVIDVGTSSLRVAEIANEGTLVALAARPVPLTCPAPGLAELDAEALYAQVLDACAEIYAEAKAAGRKIEGVGIANQRATTVVWEKETSATVGPALSWNDLRTLEQCLNLKAEGFTLAPNESATKITHLLESTSHNQSDLLAGTLDTWLVWRLSDGKHYVTDRSNAGLTGLLRPDATSWDIEISRHLGLELSLLPELVPSIGIIGEAIALEGAPPIAAIVGDQQSSLVGQGCLAPGLGKGTFGTGAAIDICLGNRRVDFQRRGPRGSFPIVCWTEQAQIKWGVEALDLTAGTCVKWLCEQLEIIDSPKDSQNLALQCEDSGGVFFVPALEGLGAPEWDFGARGTFLGLTRGTHRAHIARAVLEGVAYRGAELVRTAEEDADIALSSLRIDGGMSRNEVFGQALADALGRPVEVAAESESTVLGAGYMAGYALGIWPSWEVISLFWQPKAVVEPHQTVNHECWRNAVYLSRQWEEGLSEISFW